MQITKYRLRRVLVASTVIFSLGTVSACENPDAQLPAGTIDPSFYRTPEAAEKQSRSARFQFHQALLGFMFRSGALADELTYIPQASTQEGVGTFSSATILDTRFLADETVARSQIARLYEYVYPAMQKTRNSASLARQALNAYAPDSPPALQGEMAAYEAYMMVMLADLYCSGIPLSKIVLEGDFVYEPGSLTSQIYEQAIAVFDTAITLAAADASIRHMASIGKGRALLALGRYAEAASAVSAVPDGYLFDLPVLLGWLPDPINGTTGITWGTFYGNGWIRSNLEGTNGMDFVSAGDPRSTLAAITPTRIKIADYIEARLIQAEALAQAGDAQYLTVLNDLRANAGVGGLAPLVEPTPGVGETVLNARADLIFRERAFWLYYTGHRQGDLRRLIRHYGRTIEDTYPKGLHATGPGYYSGFIDIPVPISELPNPNFNGCFSRGA